MLYHYPARVEASKMEDKVRDLYGDTDCTGHFVAIEVFGPPEKMVHIKSENTQGGPWVVGPADEAYAYAEATGYDFEAQYELHPIEEL